MDTQWFVQKIKQSKYQSIRQLAKHVILKSTGKPINDGALNRTLHGIRNLHLSEASQIADLLNLSLLDVLTHSGLRASADQHIPVIGKLDGNLDLTWFTKAKELVIGPADMSSGAVAVRITSARTDLDAMDGWTLFCEGKSDDPASYIGRICLVRWDGKGTIGQVRQGYKKGTINLIRGIIGNLDTLENIQPTSIHKVILIQQ